ncbi:MAG TPA: hypothetical protein VII72_17045 [Myxococcota bacterium]
MIRFVMTRGHERTHTKVVKDPAAPRIELLHYDGLFASRQLPRAAYVFTDLDRLAPWDLELAAAVHRDLAAAGLPVLNDPARARTRFALLRALHEAGLNDFNAYRLDEGVRPTRYPVFLRRAAGHGRPLSKLLADWSEAQGAIDRALARGIPESGLLLIEYAAEPVAPGLFRKLALSRIGSLWVPQICVHDERWLVKYGKAACATPELYEEEFQIVSGNPFAEPVQRAFEIAGIEYGRADFGLVGGRVQIYEINTNPTLKPGTNHPVARRAESLRLVWKNHMAAFRELDPGPLPGDPVALRSPRLLRHQGLLGRLIRSRETP